MSKRTVFTTITPLPPNITRQAVIDFLHSYEEMIDLNPLVKERHPIIPPLDADPEEARCIWYSLTDKITYLPGGLATGDISYTCVFHNLPNGLQTHCRAPLGVDIRDKWTLNGSLPGEPAEPVELGTGAPSSGLYIREDVDLRCNMLMAAFVKKTLKKSHATLVAKLATKAQMVSASETAFRAESVRRARTPDSLRPGPRPGHRYASSVGSSPAGLGIMGQYVSPARSEASGAVAGTGYFPYQQQRTSLQPPKGYVPPPYVPISNISNANPYPEPLRISRPSSTRSSSAPSVADDARYQALQPTPSVCSRVSQASSVTSFSHSLDYGHPDYPVMNPYADGIATPVVEPEAWKTAQPMMFAELAGNEAGWKDEKVVHPISLQPGMSATLSGPFIAELE